MKTRRLALMIALVSVLPAAPSAFAAVTNGSAPDLGAYEYVPEPAGLGLLGLFTIYKFCLESRQRRGRFTMWRSRRKQ